MFRNSNSFIIILLLCFSYVGFSQNKQKIIEAVNLNIGITLFKNPFQANNTSTSDMAYVSKAMALGIEIYNKSFDLGIEFRKTMWYSLSASNYSTDINATCTYNSIGLNKYFNVKKKVLLASIAHIWCAEYDVTFSYKYPVNKTSLYTLKDYWTSKSISLALGISLSEKIFLDVRFNYYYYVSGYYAYLKKPEKIRLGINENQIQLSVIFKINPLKNSNKCVEFD